MAAVLVLSRAMVLPAQPTLAHTHLFLSCMDIVWRFVPYNHRLIFYESALAYAADDGQPAVHRRPAAAALMEQLKSSLALCLVHYYPWCGRLAEAAQPPHRLFIDCSDAGVEFVEASSPLPLSHLARDGFLMNPLFQQLCQQPDHKGDCLFSSPLLSIQATLFSDGGLALGIAYSHVVADGQSLWDFMVSWGECSRGVPPSTPPLHNREMLAVLDPSPDKFPWSPKPRMNEEDFKEEEERYPEIKENSLTKKDEEYKLSSAGVDKDKDSNPLVPFVFMLSASAIKKLKSEAGGAHTSFEVMCAHFWKHFVAAGRENAPTYFYAPVNCRSRMAPPLPSSFFGNALACDVILSTVGALQRETLGATACRIHDSVARVNEDFIRGFMHWLETHNYNVADTFSSILGIKGVNTASSPWFPRYQVDFGWGKPIAVRPVSVRHGELVLSGGIPGYMPGDVEICTALPESVLKRLLNDPAFLARAPCGRVAND